MAVTSSDRQKAALYAAAIEESKPEYLRTLRELHRLQVCARCCLRFAAVRSDVYSQPAPPVELLCEALAARSSPVAESGATQHSSCSPEVAIELEGHSGRGIKPADLMSEQPSEEAAASVKDLAESSSLHLPATTGEACREQNGQARGPPQPNSTGLEPVCRVCLGVLQCLDGPVCPLTAEANRELPDTDNCGAPWAPLQQGSIAAIAEHIEALGFDNKSFAVELSVPASAQLRQLAMWRHLGSLPETATLFQGQTFRDDAVDLKESLRLRGVVTQPLVSCLGKPHDPDKGDLKVTISYIHPSSAHESDFLYGKPQGGRSKNRKRKRTTITVGRSATEGIATLAGALSTEELQEFRGVPPPAVEQAVHLMVSCRRVPQYIGGLYRKLQRDVSQSPWVIDGAKKGRTSVQEEIERVLLPALRCDGAKFITAGREDMDVRMLGGGRPFVMEIHNQRSAMPSLSTFADMQTRLQESAVGVEVRKLQPVQKEKLQAIKEGEQHKQKSYEALCELPCPVTSEMVAKINSCRDLVLAQTTPARVAHRRAMLVRERTVYEMQCALVAENEARLLLKLRTQAGTYIKEFVHGDEGRTSPSLGSLLGCTAAAKILSLDVLEVLMDFL